MTAHLPILVDCEGTDALGHRAICPPTHGLCPMCGQVMSLNDDGTMPPHRRSDLIAMLKRGDFDEGSGS